MNLIIESWTERERGWGSRPDGWSAYLNLDERSAFLEVFYSGQPRNYVPDEYTQADGNPKIIDVTNLEILGQVEKNGYYRTYNNHPDWKASE